MQAEAGLRHQYNAMQSRREMARRDKMQRERDEIKQMDELERQCEEWSQGCPICKASGMDVNEQMERYGGKHGWQRCRHEDADGMRVILSMMMAKVAKTNGVSGCPDCFLPQMICKSWEEDHTRGYGLYKRSRGGCQYDGLVMAAVAALITCGTEDELSQREEWIKEQQEGRGQRGGVEWMKARVVIGRYETNEMCRFFNVWG
jgi:hypothetical protein